MKVVTVRWYSHIFLTPAKDRSISDDAIGGTAHNPHFTGMCRRSRMSKTSPVPMVSKIERHVILKTVPSHFFHSHCPAGSYSHTTGRFDCWVCANSVNRFKRLLSSPQPNSDGIPMESNHLLSVAMACANTDCVRDLLILLCNDNDFGS